MRTYADVGFLKDAQVLRMRFVDMKVYLKCGWVGGWVDGWWVFVCVHSPSILDTQVYNTATRVHIELTVDDQKIRAAARYAGVC